jgi:H+/Cl- antiporter ClcA
MNIGRLLIGVGSILVIAGAVVILTEKAGIHLGRLRGDIHIEGRHGTFYFPIVTCLIVSVVLSLISWLFRSR